MSGVLAFVEWVAYLCGKHASMVGVGEVGGAGAGVLWVEQELCLCTWRTSMVGVSGMLMWGNIIIIVIVTIEIQS